MGKFIGRPAKVRRNIASLTLNRDRALGKAQIQERIIQTQTSLNACTRLTPYNEVRACCEALHEALQPARMEPRYMQIKTLAIQHLSSIGWSGRFIRRFLHTSDKFVREVL